MLHSAPAQAKGGSSLLAKAMGSSSMKGNPIKLTEQECGAFVPACAKQQGGSGGMGPSGIPIVVGIPGALQKCRDFPSLWGSPLDIGPIPL